MEIEYLNVTQLIPYARNPRKNQQAVAAVAASILAFIIFGNLTTITLVSTGDTLFLSSYRKNIENLVNT